MDLKDYLKKTIPEYQQGNQSLDSYLDSAGDFLNGIAEAIEHFDFSHDYEKGEAYNIENSLLGRGVNAPRALPTDVKRLILRDLQEILLKNGTEDALVHSLRLIGFNAEIRRGWLPSPRSMKKGFIKDPETGEMRRYDIDKYVYTELLYGTEEVTEDGVFFNGYRYDDTFQENIIEGLPILGETYKTFPDSDVAVSKTPYVIVRFDEGDFNVSVESYVDPETGEEYTYSSDEEFRLVNEVIDYFIRGQFRPTTIRVIIIVSLQPFFEEMELEETYEEEHIYSPDGGDEYDETVGTLAESAAVLATVDVNDTSVGTPLLIGMETPYDNQLSIIQAINIGTDQIEVSESAFWGEYTVEYNIYLDQPYPMIPVRPLVDITTQSPTDANMVVYGVVRDADGDMVETLISEVPINSPFTYTTGVDYHFIRFESTSSESVPITLVYNSN